LAWYIVDSFDGPLSNEMALARLVAQLYDAAKAFLRTILNEILSLYNSTRAYLLAILYKTLSWSRLAISGLIGLATAVTTALQVLVLAFAFLYVLVAILTTRMRTQSSRRDKAAKMEEEAEEKAAKREEEAEEKARLVLLREMAFPFPLSRSIIQHNKEQSI
jgi:C4-dicarboxylate-specific signal transduction histidine kinase